jgi:hypothetical protein
MKPTIVAVLLAAALWGYNANRTQAAPVPSGVAVVAFCRSNSSERIKWHNLPKGVELRAYDLGSDEARRRNVRRPCYIIERDGVEQYRVFSWAGLIKVLFLLFRMWTVRA